jgi:transcriptional regulator with XRE-family HTH domain
MKNTQNKAQFIGNQIKIAREEEGLSQMDLAKKLNFTSATAISLIESGERKITAENLEKISSILHRDLYFFLGKDSKYTGNIEMALRADNTVSDAAKETIKSILKMDSKKK